MDREAWHDNLKPMHALVRSAQVPHAVLMECWSEFERRRFWWPPAPTADDDGEQFRQGAQLHHHMYCETYLRKDHLSMEGIATNACRHPFIKEGSLEWKWDQHRELAETNLPHNDWLIRFQVWNAVDTIFCGYRDVDKIGDPWTDSLGVCITTAWMLIPSEWPDEQKHLLHKLLSNLCGYRSDMNAGVGTPVEQLVAFCVPQPVASIVPLLQQSHPSFIMYSGGVPVENQLRLPVYMEGVAPLGQPFVPDDGQRQTQVASTILQPVAQTRQRHQRWYRQFCAQVVATASAADFPRDIHSTAPLGDWYGEWADLVLWTALGSRHPDSPKQSRNFVERVTHEGVLMKRVMQIIVGDDWFAIADAGFLSDVELQILTAKRQALILCCDIKHDNRDGAPLADSPFQESSFEGQLDEYIHHLCQDKTGQAILFDDTYEPWWESLYEANPRSPDMHHPQFFVNAAHDGNRDDAEAQARKHAFEYHHAPPAAKKKKKNATAMNAFCDAQKHCTNSVYKPNNDGTACRRMRCVYHTFPSLLWECCEHAPIWDICRHFHRQRQLLSGAPHAPSGKPCEQMKADRHRRG